MATLTTKNGVRIEMKPRPKVVFAGYLVECIMNHDVQGRRRELILRVKINDTDLQYENESALESLRHGDPIHLLK